MALSVVATGAGRWTFPLNKVAGGEFSRFSRSPAVRGPWSIKWIHISDGPYRVNAVLSRV